MEGGIAPLHLRLLRRPRIHRLLQVDMVVDMRQQERRLLRITLLRRLKQQLHLITEHLHLLHLLLADPRSKVVAMIMEVLLLLQDMEVLLHRRMEVPHLLHQTMEVVPRRMGHRPALLRQAVEDMGVHLRHRVEELRLLTVEVTTAMVLLHLVLTEVVTVGLRHQLRDMVEVHLHHKTVDTRIAEETATVVVEVEAMVVVVVVDTEVEEGMVDMEVEGTVAVEVMEAEMVVATVAAEVVVDIMEAAVEGMEEVEAVVVAAVEIRCSRKTLCLCLGCPTMPMKMT